MIYKAAREVADEMSGITFSGPHQQVREEIAELISAKFAPLVEAAQRVIPSCWLIATSGNVDAAKIHTDLREALEKIL